MIPLPSDNGSWNCASAQSWCARWVRRPGVASSNNSTGARSCADAWRSMLRRASKLRRVLVATANLGLVGGVETYLRAVLPRLASAGFELGVLAEAGERTGGILAD